MVVVTPERNIKLPMANKARSKKRKTPSVVKPHPNAINPIPISVARIRGHQNSISECPRHHHRRDHRRRERERERESVSLSLSPLLAVYFQRESANESNASKFFTGTRQKERQRKIRAEERREKVKEAKRARALRLSSIIFPSRASETRARESESGFLFLGKKKIFRSM